MTTWVEMQARNLQNEQQLQAAWDRISVQWLAPLTNRLAYLMWLDLGIPSKLPITDDMAQMVADLKTPEPVGRIEIEWVK